MNRLYSSTMAHGQRLLSSPAERAEYKKMAIRHKGRLDQLCKAAANNDQNRVVHLVKVILDSDAAKILAVARTIKWKSGDAPVSLAELKGQAAFLNPYLPIDEVVRQIDADKFDIRPRLAMDFGPKRRALQRICADILDAALPNYEFDYLATGKGADKATLRLIEIMETGKFDWVGVVDLANAFGSVNKENIALLLPLPASVTRNVLLIQDDVVVELIKEVNDAVYGLPLCISTHICSSAHTSARRGLPQGSLASSLIMSRGVIGPLLNATLFSKRIVLYGDDIATAGKSKAEVAEMQSVLRSAFENISVGPLTIGRQSIRHSSQRINFAKYGIKRDAWNPNGPLEACPSAKGFDNFVLRAEAKYLNGPVGEAADRVIQYRDEWPKAFPLWQPNEYSLDLLWFTAFEASQNAQRQKS